MKHLNKTFKEDEEYQSEIINILKNSNKNKKKKSFKKLLNKTLSKSTLNIISIILIFLSIIFKYLSLNLKGNNLKSINRINKENIIFAFSTFFASCVLFLGIHRFINLNLIMLFLLLFWFGEIISKKIKYENKENNQINLFLELILINVSFFEFTFLNIRFIYNKNYNKIFMTFISGIFVLIFYIKLNGIFIKLK